MWKLKAVCYVIIIFIVTFSICFFYFGNEHAMEQTNKDTVKNLSQASILKRWSGKTWQEFCFRCL